MKKIFNWKGFATAFVAMVLISFIDGCGKHQTVTTDKPALSSVTTVETVPVLTKQTKTTTFDDKGKPVKVEVKPIPEPGK